MGEPERPHLRFDPEHGCIEQKIGDVAQRDWAFRPVEPAEALAENWITIMMRLFRPR